MKLGFLLSFVIYPLSFVYARCYASSETSALKKIPKDGFRRFAEFMSELEEGTSPESLRPRQLNDVVTELPLPDPPRRTCGQVIGLTTRDQITTAVTAFVETLFPLDSEQGAFQPLILSNVLPIVKYDIQAQVVCSSCDEIRQEYNAAAWLDDSERHGFNSYCAEGSFGANVIQSGLLLVPHDPETGEPVSGIVKTFIRNKASDIRAHTSALSEVWPDTFDIFGELEGEDLAAAIGALFDGWPALAAATTGVVAIAPDYVGFGQSYQEFPQYFIPQYYQRSVSIIFLKSKMIVEASGCTIVGEETSAGGFSEGGFAAFIGALGLEAIGQTIVYVGTGGAPFNSLRQLSWATGNFISGNATALSKRGVLFSASSLSSVNPDLANSNVGQDFATEEWLSPTNPLQNVLEIQKSDLSNEQLDALMPEPASAIYQEMADKIELQLQQGILNPCATTTPGVDDLLCETLEMGMIIQDVEQTTFPTTICHSPEDDVVTKEASVDLDAITDNPLLSVLSVLGITADSGTHVESGFVCEFALMSQFTVLGIPDVLTGIEPLPDQSTCSATTATPGTSSPPTMAPMMTTTPETSPPTEPPTSGTFVKSHMLLSFLVGCAVVTSIMF